MRDQLLKVFKELRKEGFLARANFMCCQNCAGYDLTVRAEELWERGKQIKGAVFWTRQDEEDLRRRGKLYLSYGPCESVKFGTIGLSTEEVGKIVCEKLRKYGIPYEWGGDPATRILVG